MCSSTTMNRRTFLQSSALAGVLGALGFKARAAAPTPPAVAPAPFQPVVTASPGLVLMAVRYPAGDGTDRQRIAVIFTSDAADACFLEVRYRYAGNPNAGSDWRTALQINVGARPQCHVTIDDLAVDDYEVAVVAFDYTGCRGQITRGFCCAAP